MQPRREAAPAERDVAAGPARDVPERVGLAHARDAHAQGAPRRHAQGARAGAVPARRGVPRDRAAHARARRGARDDALVAPVVADEAQAPFSPPPGARDALVAPVVGRRAHGRARGRRDGRGRRGRRRDGHERRAAARAADGHHRRRDRGDDGQVEGALEGAQEAARARGARRRGRARRVQGGREPLAAQVVQARRAHGRRVPERPEPAPQRRRRPHGPALRQRQRCARFPPAAVCRARA